MFALSEEHELFRTTVRRFVDREIRPVAHELEHSGAYPDQIVAGMAELGLFGLTVPEEYGGLGADLLTMVIAFEELARGWMGVAGILGSHSLSCSMIAEHGTTEQKEQLLPDLATGVRRTGIALTEADAGTDLQGISTRAWLDGDEYVIRGSKMWITNARHADPLPVLVKTDWNASPAHTGMSVLLVPAGTPGMVISRDLPKLGYRGPETCEIAFDDARVPASALLGNVTGRGLQQVLSALEVGRLNVAARSVGIAQEALDQSLGYSGERRAFGQAIADFQAIQLKLADMATRVHAARLMTWWAACAADQVERADAEAGMAKLFASEVAIDNAMDAMRIHGGAGYSQELDIERLYRDAPLMAIGEGTSDVMRLVIAKALRQGTARASA